jgi:hypothetical protein
MATETQDQVQDDVEENEVDVEHDQEEAGQQDDETAVDESSDEVVVSIGDEPVKQEEDDAAAPEWVRNLRKEHRQLKKEKRELEEKLKAGTAEKKDAELRKKPSLEGHDYNTETYEPDLAAWFEEKRVVDERAKRAVDEQEAQNKEWQDQLATYTKLKGELKVADYDDAESIVRDALSVTQQGIIIKGTKNPALVVFALGKNEAKVKELASIKDPIKFAFACADLESQLKVTQKKTAPAPEKVVTGTAKSSGAVDSTLERLRADAEKTGDMSKVIAYKRQKKTA